MNSREQRIEQLTREIRYWESKRSRRGIPFFPHIIEARRYELEKLLMQ